MIDVAEITKLHQDTVDLWHRQEIANPYGGFLAVVCEQHKFNFLLWHEEDLARSPDASDSRIAAVKRAIDGYNQKRNDAIEKLDDALLEEINARKVVLAPDHQVNTETPGSVIDRLSIITLRIFHMREQAAREDVEAAHREKAQARLAILEEQHRDLSAALGELLADIFAGRKRLKAYRQFKMYNDPTLNPAVYGTTSRRAG